ncbi:MAG: mandelate racemase [Alphaproteobacteria bacterium]|nr:mandelate racemase [Alphaproteobacteria bacterium]
MADEIPIVRGLRARPVNVPMPKPLATAGGSVTTAPLVLVDLVTDRGVTGSAYVFCYTPMALAPVAGLIEGLGQALQGAPLAPVRLMEDMQARFRLLGLQGLTMMAASVIDMAAWDALAKCHELPLCRLLGAEPTPVPTYNSKGLGLIGLERAPDEARELASEGYSAIKLRLGYPHLGDDVAIAGAVREAVGDNIRIMADYNQALDPSEAEKRARALGQLGLEWIEEPVRFDDYAGCARVREASPVPIQIGENSWGVHDMQKALDAGACDLFMPDAGKVGGVTGWLRAAGMAEPRGLKLSSHLYPEISTHLLSVTPTRHWLEFVDWAQPVLKHKLPVIDGHVTAPDVPGIGIEWDEDAVARYAA